MVGMIVLEAASRLRVIAMRPGSYPHPVRPAPGDLLLELGGALCPVAASFGFAQCQCSRKLTCQTALSNLR
jgi:hypothetical protein